MFALGCIGASGAQADGMVRLDWNGCTTSPVDKSIAPGSVSSLFVTVTGHSATHHGYRIIVNVTPSSGPDFPDAWRFEDGGCLGPDYLTIDHLLVTGGATCPNFQGPASSLQAKSYVYDSFTGRGRIQLANVYPNSVLVADPAKRYFLMRAIFDHSLADTGPTVAGVSCGGLEKPMCLTFESAGYYDADDAEVPWAIDRGAVTANDPTANAACAGATSVRSRTWGALKSLYRG